MDVRTRERKAGRILQLMARLGECYGDEPREHKREQIRRIADKLGRRLEALREGR